MDTKGRHTVNHFDKDLIPRKFGTPGIIWTWSLLVLFIAGIVAYGYQLKEGLGVTAMRDYVSWGIYISNFVFFVAISLVGSLVSAILYLAGVKWGRPLNRIAEIIAVASIIFAGLIIIVDMGRPDRVWHLLVFGRLQSPIIWDVLVITTYLALSLLLLYFTLLPDLAIIGHQKRGTRLGRIYTRLSLNWKGTRKQVQILNKSVRILAITIIPMAFAIHTVTSWLFATTYRPGWDSTNFGPYFVSGAFLAGAAAVAIAMYFYRKFYHFEDYLTNRHFDNMGKLIVLLSLLYIYFNINEYLVPGFKMKANEEEHLISLFTGDFSGLFWAVIGLGMILPTVVLLIPRGRKPFPLMVMSFLIVVGAWFKRYLIVTPTLLHPFLPIADAPESYKVYIPTFTEILITVGSLAGALLIVTFLSRYLPVIPIEENVINISRKKREVKKASKSVLIGLLLLMIAAPVEAQKKSKPKLDLSYFHEMNDSPYLTTRVRIRGDRGYDPVQGVIVNLFLNEETKSGMLGNVMTDENGEGKFMMPQKFLTAFDTLNELTFIGRILDDPNLKDRREELLIQKAFLQIEPVQTDSVNILNVRLKEGNSMGTPISDEQVFIYVKRMFGLLPIGEKYNITNETGEVTIFMDGLLPGDSLGNLEFIAKVQDHDDYGTLSTSKVLNWGVVPGKADFHQKRTLWSARDKAPIWLLLIANATIIGFWSVIGYLIIQLYFIYRSPLKQINPDTHENTIKKH